MTESTIALSVVFVVLTISTIVALLASRRIKMDLEQWSVAGRGFGVIFVWLLMAGEIYTTFAFLGASGWAYSRGGPALYILTYLTLAYAISFLSCPSFGNTAKSMAFRPSPTSSRPDTAVNTWRQQLPSLGSSLLSPISSYS